MSKGIVHIFNKGSKATFLIILVIFEQMDWNLVWYMGTQPLIRKFEIEPCRALQSNTILVNYENIWLGIIWEAQNMQNLRKCTLCIVKALMKGYEASWVLHHPWNIAPNAYLAPPRLKNSINYLKYKSDIETNYSQQANLL